MTAVKEVTKLEVSKNQLYATAEAAEAFGRRLLLAHGLSEDDASTVARCLVRADLRGVDTHGLQYLPHYLDRVRRGLINAKPKLNVQRVMPSIGGLDGDNGFGFVVATKAMAEAIDMAREFGVGIVSCRRSTHFGMAANYVLQAMDAGLIGLVFTNASPGMPPWGGRDPIIGTSPIACGAPADKRRRSISTCRRPPRRAAKSGARRGVAKPSRSALRSTKTAAPPPIRMPHLTVASCSQSADPRAPACR
jgi:LDH2 family malate/lactate/ureidoglycolate dehydrogenase